MATLPNNPNGPIYGTNGDDSGSKALVGTFAYSDTIYGQSGNDELHGRFGADYLDGGTGADKLWGDAGNDVEVGGKGNDQFNFAWQMGQRGGSVCLNSSLREDKWCPAGFRLLRIAAAG